MTCVAWYVSHHSTLLMAVGLARRQVASAAAALGGVDGGDEGRAHSVMCSVSPAQATSQSWACTTSGRQPPRRAASCDELVVGPGHAGDEVVVGQPRQLGVGPEHPHPVDDRVVGGVGMVQGEDDDLVPGPGQRPGQAVDVGGDAADDQRRVLPRQHGHSHGGPT